MIRIDLGRDSKKQGERIRKVATQLKLQQPYEELLAKFDGDVGRLVAFFLSIAVAILPYLFIGEYERVITRSYEKKIRAVEKEIAIVETEVTSLQPYKQELESYESQKNQVSQRLSVIRQLIDSRGTPVISMDAVTQAMPEGVWLESVNFDASDKMEKITVAGKALSNEDISDFVDRLAQSSYLKNVRINVVESALASSTEVRTFTLDLEATPYVAAAREVGGSR